MTQNVAMRWQPQFVAGDFAAQETLDFTVDQSWQFNISSDFQGERVTPNFILVDNFSHSAALTLSMQGITFQIPAGTGRTFNYPAGMTSFSIVSADALSTATITVSEKKYVDDISNQVAVVSPPPSSNSMQIVRTVITASGSYVVPVSCYAMDVTIVGGGAGGIDADLSIAGGGGSSGGVAKKLYSTVVPGNNCTIVIGTAGARNANGVDSTFTDGTTLITGPGGVAPVGSGSSDQGGLGLVGINGDTNFVSNGKNAGGRTAGGVGNLDGGNGGEVPFGKCGRGGINGGNGTAAAGFGCGGGGGSRVGGGAGGNGAAGSAGICVIDAYIAA